MNFARTALLLVVLSFSAGAAELEKTQGQHAEVGGEAAQVTAQPRPQAESDADFAQRYNKALNACLLGRQDFGAPNPGIAPLTNAR